MKKYIAAILILLSVMSIISILFCGILFIGYDVPYSDSCEYMMYVSIVILGACVTAIICCFVKKNRRHALRVGRVICDCRIVDLLAEQLSEDKVNAPDL